jgi:hypothetical protein
MCASQFGRHLPCPAPHFYSAVNNFRDFTGEAARIRIEDPQGNGFLHIYFWDDPDTAEALLAEKKAKMLVGALNLTGGGQVELPQLWCLLQERRQIAAIWSVHDVQQIRPDLTQNQAWEVLQRVNLDDDFNQEGITRKSIRRATAELFPQTCQQKHKGLRAMKSKTQPRRRTR